MTNGKSLAYQKFSKTIEAEIRNFYHISTSLIYATRWWNSIADTEQPNRITGYPGDNVHHLIVLIFLPRNI